MVKQVRNYTMIPTVNIEHGTNGLTASVSGDCKAPLFLIISQSFTCWTFEVKHLHSETAVLHQLLRFSDKSPLDWILSLDSFSLPLLLIKHCPPLAALARVPSAQLSYSRSPMTETQRHWEKKKTDKKKKRTGPNNGTCRVQHAVGEVLLLDQSDNFLFQL